MQFDIYPSISEDLLEENNRGYTIHRYRKRRNINNKALPEISTILSVNVMSQEKNNNITFDVGIGSYGGAEVSELIGIFLL